jgi:murein L,D-transpeptidase YcbB/YkuD
MMLSRMIGAAAFAVAVCQAPMLSAVGAVARRCQIETLWTDSAGRPRAVAHEAVRLLATAEVDGLDPADYGAAEAARVEALLQAAPCTDPSAPAALDTVLTTGMVRYLHDLHRGRVDPRTVGFRVAASAEDHDVASLLRAAVAQDRLAELVAELTPPLAQYRDARAALARYRDLARSGLELVRSAAVPGHSVRPGQPYADAGRLYAELVAFGDLPRDTPRPVAPVYENALIDGVKRFQTRHGLTPDGNLGTATLAQLQVPLSKRVRQIELTLERLRWLPEFDNEPFVAVNVAMFRLWALDPSRPGGAVPLDGKVIVGRTKKTPTPLFVGEMRYVTFRPYWNVPSSILLHEVLPAMRRDPEYLRRQDMEIVRGSGDDATVLPVTAGNIALLRTGALRVRQRPGPRNALGLVAFAFPNADNIYMHDTPARALFARDRRDLSHGCVRVEDAASLAEWVLTREPGWTASRVRDAIHGTETVRVPLTQPVHVVLFYATALVIPPDGTVHFADDVYGHDARLDRALTQAARGGRTIR